ncbi:MAG: hypothetical protein J6K78_05955 [Tidjanibacter sp.]|nr:hypothetical protein [Tidjanibacter sp.]
MELRNRQGTTAPYRCGWYYYKLGEEALGDVKSVKVTQYNINELTNKLKVYEVELNREGHVEECRQFDDNGTLLEREVYNYGLPDNNVEVSVYNGDGVLLEQDVFSRRGLFDDLDFTFDVESPEWNEAITRNEETECKYDDNGELAEMARYVNGNLAEKVLYQQGNMVEQTYYYNGVFRVRNCMKYDSEGRLLKKECYDVDGNLCGQIVYVYTPEGKIEEATGDFNMGGNIANERFVWRYDKNDQILEESVYTADGTLKQQDMYEYFPDGKKMSERSELTQKNSGVKRSFCKYDTAGNIVEEWELNPDGFEYRNIDTYDEQGNLKERRAFCPSLWDGCIRSICQYDEMGDCVEAIHFRGTQMSAKELWKYDSVGNLIEYEYYYYLSEDEVQLSLRVVREITYWD